MSNRVKKQAAVSVIERIDRRGRSFLVWLVVSMLPFLGLYLDGSFRLQWTWAPFSEAIAASLFAAAFAMTLYYRLRCFCVAEALQRLNRSVGIDGIESPTVRLGRLNLLVRMPVFLLALAIVSTVGWGTAEGLPITQLLARAVWSLSLAWVLAWSLANAVYLAQISSTLGVSPWHGDGCGGMQPFGDCCVQLSVVPTTIIVLLSSWVFVPPFKDFEGIQELAIFTLVPALVLSGAALIYPLRRVHDAIEAARDRILAELATAIRSEVEQIVGLPPGEGDGAASDSSKKRTDLLFSLRDRAAAISCLPVNVKLAAGVVVPQVTAVVSAITKATLASLGAGSS